MMIVIDAKELRDVPEAGTEEHETNPDLNEACDIESCLLPSFNLHAQHFRKRSIFQIICATTILAY